MRSPGKNTLIPVFILFLVTSMFAACSREQKSVTLSSPANVDISAEGRIITITWDAVDNAVGYEIVTTSVGCSSGNRTINTKEETVVITSNKKAASNVKIDGETSIKITLMAKSGDRNSPMASAVTAKVMSLGGTVSGKVYNDSEYSETVEKTL